MKDSDGESVRAEGTEVRLNISADSARKKEITILYLTFRLYFTRLKKKKHGSFAPEDPESRHRFLELKKHGLTGSER